MSVFQVQSALHSPLYSSCLPTTGSLEWPVCNPDTARLSLFACITGFWRRVRRTLTQLDACDMTPERATAYQQVFERIMPEDNMAAPDTRRVLEACVPLLYNIRVPSARAQYLRQVAFLAPGYAERPEQFMLQMLPIIELYGRGLSSREVLQAARL